MQAMSAFILRTSSFKVEISREINKLVKLELGGSWGSLLTDPCVCESSATDWWIGGDRLTDCMSTTVACELGCVPHSEAEAISNGTRGVRSDGVA